MFRTNTILALKEPVPKDDPKDEEEAEFPYNKVRVVGPSPIIHPIKPEDDWSAEGGNQGVLIEPQSSFAANLDEPYGKLKKLYKVEFEPDPVEHETVTRVIAYDANENGPTPEEVFAAEAPGKAPKKGEKRARTPFDVQPEIKPRSPLGGKP